MYDKRERRRGWMGAVTAVNVVLWILMILLSVAGAYNDSFGFFEVVVFAVSAFVLLPLLVTQVVILFFKGMRWWQKLTPFVLVAICFMVSCGWLTPADTSWHGTKAMARNYERHRADLDSLVSYTRRAADGASYVSLEYNTLDRWAKRKVQWMHVDSTSWWSSDLDDSICLGSQMLRAGLTPQEMDTIHRLLRRADGYSITVTDSTAEVGYRFAGFGAFSYRLFDRPLGENQMVDAWGDDTQALYSDRVIFCHGSGAIGSDVYPGKEEFQATRLDFLRDSCGFDPDNPNLRPCDLLFYADEGGMDDAVRTSTGDYTHVALVESVTADTVWIIDATRRYGVSRRPLMRKPGDKTYPDVYRLNVAIDTFAVLRRARALIGRPYDNAFLPTNDAFYCSELIVECYVEPDGRWIFHPQPMNWRDADGNMPQYWIDHFDALGMEVPEGVLGSNPTDLSQSSMLRKL